MHIMSSDLVAAAVSPFTRYYYASPTRPFVLPLPSDHLASVRYLSDLNQPRTSQQSALYAATHTHTRTHKHPVRSQRGFPACAQDAADADVRCRRDDGTRSIICIYIYRSHRTIPTRASCCHRLTDKNNGPIIRAPCVGPRPTDRPTELRAFVCVRPFALRSAGAWTCIW